jgi:DNA-binding NarL/FixJ family response regulator
MPPIRLLIVDDHQFFRWGLRLACELEEDFDVVGEAENGQEAVELARRTRPDIVLMDIEMPILDGVQATGLITEENPETRVLVLTVFQKDEYVFEAIKAGAWGYLLKGVDEQALGEAIRAAHRGDVLIDAHVAAKVLEEFRRLSETEAQDQQVDAETDWQADVEMERLTESEMDVLRLVAQGKDNRTIARQLSLSEKTITNRLSIIYQKLRVNSRVQAALYALRRGWVQLDSEKGSRPT